MAYHDVEWGVPVHDDRKLFEFLILSPVRLAWVVGDDFAKVNAGQDCKTSQTDRGLGIEQRSELWCYLGRRD